MANLTKKVLGSVSGRVGDLVFRQRDGANIIAIRPGSFRIPMDQESIDRRSKFGIAVKLASFLSRIPELYNIWADHDSTRSPFNSLVKANYPYIDPECEAGNFRLTPQTGFGTSAGSVTMTASEVQAELNPLGEGLGITDDEVGAKLISMIYLNDPIDANEPKYNFIELTSEEIPLETGTQMIFSLPLMNQDTQLYNAYQDKNAYFTLVTLDADGNTVQFSNTFRKV